MSPNIYSIDPTPGFLPTKQVKLWIFPNLHVPALTQVALHYHNNQKTFFKICFESHSLFWKNYYSLLDP